MKSYLVLGCLSLMLFAGCTYEEPVCNTSTNLVYQYFKQYEGKELSVVAVSEDGTRDPFAVRIDNETNGEFRFFNPKRPHSLAAKSFSTCSTQGYYYIEFTIEKSFGAKPNEYRMALAEFDKNAPHRLKFRWLGFEESKLKQAGIPYEGKYSDGDPEHGIFAVTLY